MYLADSLSRPCDVDGVSTKHCASVECFVACNAQEILSNVREQELFESLSSDIVSQQCLSYIGKRWPDKIKSAGEIAKLFNMRNRLTSWHGFIFYDHRLYIPHVLRRTYLALFHDHHLGVKKTKRAMTQFVWWPAFSADVAAFIAECDTCIKHGSVKHQPLQLTPLPEGPWKEAAVDVFVFAGKLFLVIVDYYTRWIEAPSIYSQSSGVVIAALKSVFARMGVPRIIRSDNGACFTSREMQQFALKWDFTQTFSSPRYPQSNGMAELAVGTVKRLWSTSADKDGVLLAYRSTPLKSGFSPNQLMFGRAVRSAVGYGLFEETEQRKRAQITAKWNNKYSAKQLSTLKPGQRV